ncbi:MAG: TSUP family transporter [Pseudomonadota bacterium]
MPIDILLTVVVTATIQSIFGVGVLLFGTPLLLLLGYDFINTLIILLPISISINAFQIVKHFEHIDRRFYQNILSLTVPCIVLFLVLVTSTKINIGVVIGLFLILVALKNYSREIERFLEAMVMKHEKPYFVAMGVIHGLTNLGGSLLTAIVHEKNYDKDISRVTIAASYATFAVFQVLTLLFTVDSFNVTWGENISYLVIGVMVFVLTEEMVYAHLDNEQYAKIFAVFLFASGTLLVGKSF